MERKYPPKIEKLLNERGLLDKSKEEKQKTHKKAMDMIDKTLTKEERIELVKTMEKIL